MSDEMSDRERALQEGLNDVQRMGRRLKAPPYITLTTMAQMMERAISHGAEIYNEGDGSACYRIYSEAASLIIEAARHGDATPGPQSEEVLDDLTRALARGAEAQDKDFAAWVMRHSFDKTIVLQQVQMEKLQWMMRLGETAFARSDYGGSADALRTATETAEELWAIPKGDDEDIQTSHLAFLYYGHVLLLTEQYKDAYDILTGGVVRTPQLGAIDFDLSDLGEHYDAFRAELDKLEELPDDHAAAPYTLFLRAYIHVFSNERRRATELLSMHLGNHPDDEAAQSLLAMTASETQA